LTEDIKLQIDKRIEERQKDHLSRLDTARLELDNELYKLRDRVNSLISEQQKTLTELDLHKWGLRILWVLLLGLLGGSILGLLKYDEYLDRRMDSKIGARAIKSDRLGLAVSKAYYGQWRGSL